MHTVILGLGTNLGDKEGNILEAYRLLEKSVGTITKRSSMLKTEPWGFESDNTFLNSVVKMDTSLTPHEVLAATQEIEREMGRTQKSVNGVYHDRVIDIDILIYDDLTIDDPDLKIPHPLMEQRDFVMIPLREVL